MFWLDLGLKLLGFFIQTSKTSETTKRKFLELIEATKNDGLITVKTHDTFKEQYKQLTEGKSNGQNGSPKDSSGS